MLEGKRQCHSHNADGAMACRTGRASGKHGMHAQGSSSSRVKTWQAFMLQQ